MSTLTAVNYEGHIEQYIDHSDIYTDSDTGAMTHFGCIGMAADDHEFLLLKEIASDILHGNYNLQRSNTRQYFDASIDIKRLAV